jgi:hypothetical protein
MAASSRPGLTGSAPTPGDHTLVSVGSGGAAYFWDVRSAQRQASLEYVDKQCVYGAVAYLPSGQGEAPQPARSRTSAVA